MKTKKKIIWGLVGTVGMLASGSLLLGFFVFGLPNDLGLTRFDLYVGGKPDIELLREKTKAAADDFLLQHQAELSQVCGGPCISGLEAALSSRIRSLGYRSSFYYYCWDIYLPYSLQPQSGGAFTAVVQLSDAIQGHGHDPSRFRVLCVMVIDGEGNLMKEFEG